MKHIILDTNWKWTDYPFPQYQCELIFGKNHWDFTHIPIKKGVYPQEDERGLMILPTDRFDVIEEKRLGGTVIAPAEFNTNDSNIDNRCLAFVGISEGFRGNKLLLKGEIDESTTAEILTMCSAHNRWRGHTSIAALFSPGERLVIHSEGRKTDQVTSFEYTLNGQLISTIRASKSSNIGKNK